MWELNHIKGWAPKNWCFRLWCWGKPLRVHWTARRSNQSTLKGINPEYSLEGLMLKLKLQYLDTWCQEPTHWKRPWCWERLKTGGEGDDRGWDGWMASPARWKSLSKLQEMVKDRGAWGAAVHRFEKSDWATEQEQPPPLSRIIQYRSSVTGLFHFMFSSSIHMWHMSEFPSCLRLSSTLLSMPSVSFVHVEMNTRDASIFWLLWAKLLWTWCAHTCLSLYSDLLRMYPEVELLKSVIILCVIFFEELP